MYGLTQILCDLPCVIFVVLQEVLRRLNEMEGLPPSASAVAHHEQQQR
jgi:hypothetical protein